MEYRDKVLCVGYSDLVPGVMSEGCLKKLISRRRVERVKRGGGEGSCCLVVYGSLPEKYKTRFVAVVGDPEAILRESMMKEYVRTDAEARRFYEDYTYWLNGEERHLPDRLIEEYTVNASVVGELLRLSGERAALRRALGSGSAGNMWGAVQAQCERLRPVYGHTLPENLSRLKDKLNAFKRDGYGALVSGKVGNTSTRKITDEVARQLIALKRGRVPVLTDAQILDAFNAMAPARGWKTLSLRGLTEWLYSAAVEPLWYDAVHGEQAARQRFGRKHRTALPTRRDSLWYGDGTKLNLYYRDEQGHVRTTQVYEVIDAMSEVLLGYHISDSEDYEAQYHAYRMAIQTSGHKPYEIVHDNQGGHKRLESDGLFGKLCHVHRTTQPYNGESKTIESVFGRFQQQVLHKDWRFTGQNVTARKASSRPNIEFIEANKDSLYTLDELKDAYAAARREWNSLPHPLQKEGGVGVSRLDLYEESVNEDTPAVTAHDMVDMFWVFAKRMCTFTDQGIELTVKGRKYRYEVFSQPGVPDHAWRRQHTYERFVVAYDPYDMTSVRLYSRERDGSLRFVRVAEPYIVIHRAIQDQQAADAKFIRQEQAASLTERVERQVAAKTIEWDHGVAPEQHGLHTPRLKGVTAEVQREVERRTNRYRIDPEAFQLGRHTKAVSMEDWRLEEEPEAKPIDYRRVAEKL